MCTIQAKATTWVHAIQSGSVHSASSVPQQITHFRFKLRAPKSLLLLESCTIDDFSIFSGLILNRIKVWLCAWEKIGTK